MFAHCGFRMEFRHAPHFGMPAEYSYHNGIGPTRIPSLDHRQHYFRPLGQRMSAPNVGAFLNTSTMSYSHSYPPLHTGHPGHCNNHAPNGNPLRVVLHHVRPIARAHEAGDKTQPVPGSPDVACREPNHSPDSKSYSSMETKTSKHSSDEEEHEQISVSQSSSPNTSASTSEGTSPKSRDASMHDRSPSPDSKSSEGEDIKVTCKIYGDAIKSPHLLPVD